MFHFKWVFTCFCSDFSSANSFPHSLHSGPLLLSCFSLICLFSYPSSVYPDPQYAQVKFGVTCRFSSFAMMVSHVSYPMSAIPCVSYPMSQSSCKKSKTLIFEKAISIESSCHNCQNHNSTNNPKQFNVSWVWHENDFAHHHHPPTETLLSASEQYRAIPGVP